MTLHDELAKSLQHNRVTRRQVLWLLGAGAAGIAGLSGCATSPVGGQSILVGMSEEEEKQADRQVSPQQFSQDLGPVQDVALNQYLSEIGQRLDAKTHRPQMPYSYRVLNANYVNASRVRQLLTQVSEFIRGCFKKCHYSKVSCSGNCGFVRLKAAKMLACSVLVVDSPALGCVPFRVMR